MHPDHAGIFDNGIPNPALAHHDLCHAGPVIIQHTEKLACVALLVQVNYQHGLAQRGQLSGQVAGGDAFPDAAF